jgi:bis(5'-nucleosyl)-tetraphosphatase (symmetrical)
MRMITDHHRLNFTHNASPWRARKNLLPWYTVDKPATKKTRVVFGHWSQLGLIALPDLISLDTGCVWGRQLTAIRLDKRVPRVFQVPGQS